MWLGDSVRLRGATTSISQLNFYQVFLGVERGNAEASNLSFACEFRRLVRRWPLLPSSSKHRSESRNVHCRPVARGISSFRFFRPHAATRDHTFGKLDPGAITA